MSRFTLIARVASGLNGLMGAGIMLLSPWLGGDLATRNRYEVWTSVAVGGIVMAFGMTRLASPEELPGLSWANLLLGACILLSPWLFRFSSDELLTWGGVIVGGLIMALATMSAWMTLRAKDRFARVTTE